MKALKIVGIGLGVLVAVLGGIGLMAVGVLAPDTAVYLEDQVPQKYLNEIRELGLTEEDERVIYFYSDAVWDIKAGMYFVSDQHLVLYSEEWEEPQSIIGFEEITDLDVEYDDSFFVDTYVTVETDSGLEVTFPVSSEKGRDKKFVEHIISKMKIERGSAGQSATRSP